MTRAGLLNCLKDRPCSVCKFRDEHGCHKWTCVFETETEDEPKKGEWIESELPGELYRCSVCGGACWSYDYERQIVKSRFCPNCGADMRKCR